MAMENLNNIFDKVGRIWFTMTASYLVDIGFRRASKLSDEEIESVEDQSWITAEGQKTMMETARQISKESSPVEFIQFCMAKEIFENPAKDRDLLWDTLKEHFGHNVEISCYGDPDDPDSVTLEDLDNGTIILDADMYTIVEK